MLKIARDWRVPSISKGNFKPPVHHLTLTTTGAMLERYKLSILPANPATMFAKFHRPAGHMPCLSLFQEARLAFYRHSTDWPT